MKKISRWVVGLCAVAQFGSAALAKSCGSDSVMDAAVVLAIEAEGLSNLLLSCSEHQLVTWDAQRLAQATSRLPGLLASGVDEFSFQRKFQRVSLLFLDVRDKLIDSLFASTDVAVVEALERLENAYLEMAFALADGDPADPIDDIRPR